MRLSPKTKWLDPNVIAIALITKIVLLVYGYQSFQILNQERIGSLYRVLEIWKRWDAADYLKLAAEGYTAVGEDRFLIVYFPLFPAAIAALQLFVRDHLIAAFGVSLIASVALAVTFRKLVRLDHGENVARHAVLFLFIFPTSYFLHIPYTESLFLALCVGCFYAARTKRWMMAGVLGFLACLTRINGIVLVVALAFEIWEEYRETKTPNPNWLWAALPGTGFLAYLGLNYLVTGNPTMFLVHQREHWFKYLRLPSDGILETVYKLSNDKAHDAVMYGAQELVFVVVGFAAIVIGWFRMRNSYRVWMVANWLIFVSTSFVLSVPRYTLILFPMFILMSVAAAKSWPAKILFITWSVMFLALFAAQFSRGWWAF